MSESDNDQRKLNVDVREGKAWKRTLEIEVPKETVDEEFETAYKKYRSEAKIPGFRKGKAPMDMVKRRFKEAIKREVLETLVPKRQSSHAPCFPPIPIPLETTNRYRVLPHGNDNTHIPVLAAEVLITPEPIRFDR